jgi:hypothetical protein
MPDRFNDIPLDQNQEAITYPVGGGLIGGVGNQVVIVNCYSTCAVKASAHRGGLMGCALADVAITNCYSIGPVPVLGYNDTGGLVGFYPGTDILTTSSYWDTQASILNTSTQGVGKTTLEMKNPATYSGWDTDIWNIVSGEYPTLKFAKS